MTAKRPTGNAAWLVACVSTAVHFGGYWLSYSGDRTLHLEIFVAGILIPVLALGYTAQRQGRQIVADALFGLGIGLFTTLPAGVLFIYCGPKSVDFYEGLAWLMYIFILPIAAVGGALAMLIWMYSSPKAKPNDE